MHIKACLENWANWGTWFDLFVHHTFCPWFCLDSVLILSFCLDSVVGGEIINFIDEIILISTPLIILFLLWTWLAPSKKCLIRLSWKECWFKVCWAHKSRFLCRWIIQFHRHATIRIRYHQRIIHIWIGFKYRLTSMLTWIHLFFVYLNSCVSCYWGQFEWARRATRFVHHPHLVHRLFKIWTDGWYWRYNKL